MAQDAGVDILNTFKKNRKDFFGEKRAEVANEQHCSKHDNKSNSLIINNNDIFKQYCSYEQNCSFPEKSNNPEKNRTILKGETFCGSFDHFIKKKCWSVTVKHRYNTRKHRFITKKQ